MEFIIEVSAYITAIGVIISTVNKIIKLRIKNLEEGIKESEKIRFRLTILAFASDLRKGIYKTRQEYETIFLCHDKYEDIIKELKQKNGYIDSEFEYIKNNYEKLGDDIYKS